MTTWRPPVSSADKFGAKDPEVAVSCYILYFINILREACCHSHNGVLSYSAGTVFATEIILLIS